MALTRARVVSASPAIRRAGRAGHRAPCYAGRATRRSVAADVVEMRGAIAQEKGDSDRWDLKYAAGGLVDLEFIAQYLQLVHAARTPDILDTSTARVLDKAWRLGLLRAEDAEVLRPAVRLYHDLTQILRLCLSGPVRPQGGSAGPDGAAGARRRRAGFRHARCLHRRDRGQGACKLRSDPRQISAERWHGPAEAASLMPDLATLRM